MKRMGALVLASVGFMALSALSSIAGPAEEANAALDRFSAAYTANDVEALVKLYAPNAILLGTNSSIISEGQDAVRVYFTNLKLAGSGNKNDIQERRTIVVNDNAVVVTGFYQFTRMSDGKAVLAPARFTVLLTKANGQWLIAHQHSSPARCQATNFQCTMPCRMRRALQWTCPDSSDNAQRDMLRYAPNAPDRAQ